MQKFRVIDQTTVIEKTTRLFGLKLAPGAELKAPEGKLLTMTFNGVQVNPAPGTYEGDVVLTITDPIHVGTMAQSDLKAAVCIGPDGVIPEKSVQAAVMDGTIQDSEINNLKVFSQGDCFSAVYIDSDEDYVLNDPVIECIGNGENESVGEGAGIITAGSGKVTINRAAISVRGAARSALFGGGHSRLEINDSTISTSGGVLPYDYQDSIAAGRMKRVPWMLGLRGNSRATNLAECAEAVYNRCTITAAEWGAMSTDGVERCRLTMKDCAIQVTGPSGYGTFALLDTVNTLDHCRVDVPDYAFIVANSPASTVITGGSDIRAGRFGAMCFRNTSGKITVNGGSQIVSGETTFVVKGCSTNFEVDNALLEPGNGIILQVMDTDDPRNPRKYFVDNEEQDVKNPNRDLTEAEGEAVRAVFRNMTINGSFFNGTTNRKYDTGPEMGDPHGSGGPGGPGTPPPPKPDEKPSEQAKNMQITLSNVSLTGAISATTVKHTVKKISKENCEDLGKVVNTPAPAVNNGVIAVLRNQTVWEPKGINYLSKLVIDETSRIMNANMTVDGVQTVLGAGNSYTGEIVITEL